MKILSIGLGSLLILTGCTDSGESYCATMQISLAEVQGILYETDEILKSRELTDDEYQDRIEAASDQTDLWIRMDEVGCPHD